MKLPSIVVTEYIIERGKLKCGYFDQYQLQVHILATLVLFSSTPKGCINYIIYHCLTLKYIQRTQKLFDMYIHKLKHTYLILIYKLWLIIPHAILNPQLPPAHSSS